MAPAMAKSATRILRDADTAEEGRMGVAADGENRAAESGLAADECVRAANRTSMTIAAGGMPRNDSIESLSSVSLRPIDTGSASVTNSAVPRRALQSPSVATNEGNIEISAQNAPAMEPSAAPTTMASANATEGRDAPLQEVGEHDGDEGDHRTDADVDLAGDNDERCRPSGNADRRGVAQDVDLVVEREEAARRRCEDDVEDHDDGCEQAQLVHVLR
jgi:hypothetical protein